jgi:diadenosine tetraphosphatase ApaH/serine/threonine PP2A family protein phosphatase
VPTHRHWIATIGSVGQPRDGDPRAAYALLDLDRHLLSFFRVRYDHGAVAQAVRAAGLDEALARRLESGR